MRTPATRPPGNNPRRASPGRGESQLRCTDSSPLPRCFRGRHRRGLRKRAGGFGTGDSLIHSRRARRSRSGAPSGGDACPGTGGGEMWRLTRGSAPPDDAVDAIHPSFLDRATRPQPRARDGRPGGRARVRRARGHLPMQLRHGRGRSDLSLMPWGARFDRLRRTHDRPRTLLQLRSFRRTGRINAA